MLRKVLTPCLFLCCLVVVAAGVTSADPVTFDRIVTQHLMHVVSTENQEDISKYLFQLRLKDQSVMRLSELMVLSSHLKDAEGVLFVIDRSKTKRLTPEEERLLPCPTSAIDANQVILYSRKASGRNAWEILISAPNAKWLFWELDRLCNSNLRTIGLDGNGSILDKYVVKRLLIVSTESRDAVQSWVDRQTSGGGDKLDWDYAAAQDWSAGSDGCMDTAFLLDKQKLGDKAATLAKALPSSMQAGALDPSAPPQMMAARETGGCTVYAVVAPGNRQMQAALSKYALRSISDSLSTDKLHDLSACGQVALVSHCSDGSTLATDLGSRLSLALSSANLGMGAASRQDLKDLVFQSNSDGTEQEKLDAAQLEQIKKKIGASCALAIANISSVDARTTYSANPPARITSPYPAFNIAEPTKPTKPDPDQTILFKGHKYRVIDGSRKNDPDYIRDLNKFQYDEMPRYQEDHRRWERNKNDDADSRRYHSMDWSRSVDSIQTVSVSGSLRIYDVTQMGDDGTPKLLFSCPLSGHSQLRQSYKSDQTSVRGEDITPDIMTAPEPKTGIDDEKIIQEAVGQACNSAVGELKDSSLLPADVPNFNLAAVQKPAELRMQHVSVQAVGSIKLSKKPAAAGISIARDAALQSAYPGLLQEVLSACPGAVITLDDVKQKAKAGSEGWNAQTHEYRVKATFEGDVSAN